MDVIGTKNLRDVIELKVSQFPDKECIVFEDAEAGVEAAINGNMHVVGIGDKQTLSKADMVVSGFKNVDLDTFLKLAGRS